MLVNQRTSPIKMDEVVFPRDKQLVELIHSKRENEASNTKIQDGT